MPRRVDWKKSRSRKELAAIAQLESAGAVIKPFDVRGIDFSGVVVRFDDDQRTDDGLISARSAKALNEFKDALLELRQTTLARSDLKRIGQLNRLRGLDVTATSGVKLDLAEFKRLSGLVILELSSNPVSDHDLLQMRRMKNLKSLSLMDTQISDDSISTLIQFRELRELYLSRTSVTKPAVLKLKTALPRCRIVV